MKEITIGFEVFGYPESSGLRVRTVNGIHLYISGQDADAVKWHFETGVVEFIVRERLLSWEGLQGLGLKEEIDWDACLIAGEGECTVYVLTTEETKEMMRDGAPIILSPVKEMYIEWWRGPNREPICIVRDKKEFMDSWIVESIQSGMSTLVKNKKAH